MALIHAGVECELREVLLSDKPAAMLAISPKGTVPVLQRVDGTVLEESLDIMLWALEKSEQSWLQPSNTDLDDMLALIASNDGDFKYHLDRYKYPNRYADATSLHNFALQHREKACEFLNKLEERLTQNHFLCGHTATLADVAIFPFVRQFAATDRAWFSRTNHKHLRHWLQNWLASDLFRQAMLKHATWQPGSTPVTLGRQTR